MPASGWNSTGLSCLKSPTRIKSGDADFFWFCRVQSELLSLQHQLGGTGTLGQVPMFFWPCLGCSFASL